MGAHSENKKVFQQALDYLSPLFGNRKFTLDDFFNKNDWKDIADRENKQKQVIAEPCATRMIAGSSVGGELLFRYNENKFEEDKLWSEFLHGAGIAYAQYAFHATLCEKECGKPVYTPVSKRYSGVGQDKLSTLLAVTHLTDTMGYVLFLNYKTKMLGPYAQMSAKSALKFLRKHDSRGDLGPKE